MRILMLALPLWLSACALHRVPTAVEKTPDEDMSARLLRDGPPRYLPVASSGIDSTMIDRGTSCSKTMHDARDGTLVQLERVLPLGRGDYVVPGARYGIKPAHHIMPALPRPGQIRRAHHRAR